MPNPDERSLDETPSQPQHQHGPHEHGDTPFGNPNGHRIKETKPLSLDEVLTSARRHREVAQICLRGDLQSAYEERLLELAGMVDGAGRLIQRDDQALDEQTAAARAQELQDEISEIRRQMNDAMRSVVFEGMPEDKWRPWFNEHYPHRAVKIAKDKGEDADLSAFNNLLIAEVAVSPTFTVDDVIKLRSQLSAPQMTELANKAWLACTTGGVDIPKSPAFLRNLQLG